MRDAGVHGHDEVERGKDCGGIAPVADGRLEPAGEDRVLIVEAHPLEAATAVGGEEAIGLCGSERAMAAREGRFACAGADANERPARLSDAKCASAKGRLLRVGEEVR